MGVSHGDEWSIETEESAPRLHKAKSLNKQPGIFNESSLSRAYRTECMYLYLLSRLSLSGRVSVRGLTYVEGILREKTHGSRQQ